MSKKKLDSQLYQLGLIYNFLAFALFINACRAQPKSQDLWLRDTSTLLGFGSSLLSFTFSSIMLCIAKPWHQIYKNVPTTDELHTRRAFRILRTVTMLISNISNIIIPLSKVNLDGIHWATFSAKSTNSDQPLNEGLFNTFVRMISVMYFTNNLLISWRNMPNPHDKKHEYSKLADLFSLICFIVTLTNTCLINVYNFSAEANEGLLQEHQTFFIFAVLADLFSKIPFIWLHRSAVNQNAKRIAARLITDNTNQDPSVNEGSTKDELNTHDPNDIEEGININLDPTGTGIELYRTYYR